MESPKGVCQSKRLDKTIRPWAAWTRYASGRWRRTFLARTPLAAEFMVKQVFGATVETVVLRAGEEPILHVKPFSKSPVWFGFSCA